jgi:dTMP kinase
MPEQNGIFIVIEGADGSGKGTQFKLLTERLKAVGYDVEVFDFPRYEEPSSHFVRKYLNGEYGAAADISPYTASLFYALDRYEAGPKIKKALISGKIVLSNRYVGSNMAHQGGKFTNLGEQRGFFIWEDGLEFELLGIPRPNMNIFLRVPAEVSYELIDKKAKRSYTDKTHDQHEGNMEHLKNSIATYDTLCKLFPKDFKAIDCAPDGKLLSIAEVNDKIWDQIKPILPAKPPHAGREVVFNLNNKEPEQPKISNTAEFAAQKPALLELDQKNSDQITITVKKVSMLAASKVQIISGINCQVALTQWGDDDKYDFYTPSGLSKKTLPRYKESLENMAKLHKKMLSRVKKADLKALTPKAALATIKISGDAAAISKLISMLRANSLSEIRWLAEQLQAGAHQLYPEMFKESSGSLNVIAQNNALHKLAPKNLAAKPLVNAEKVILEEASPRNEFSLLADALYPYSNSSRKEIAAELENWTYDQKKEAFATALSTENISILNGASYRWDILADTNTVNKLKQALNIQQLQLQSPSPNYGYDIPGKVEQAGIEEFYIESFEQSLKLFNELQESGNNDLSEYATLSGHKNRWQFVTDARALKSAVSVEQPGFTKEILSLMQEKVSERHPLISGFIDTPTPETVPPKQPVPEKSKVDFKKRSTHNRRRIRKPKK